jgi:hypothetical protein
MSRTPPPSDTSYWDRIRGKAAALGSDGCTMVTEMFVDCCYRHDIEYKTGRSIEGVPLSRREIDRRFRECIQSRSRLGRFSPVSWIRWSGVRVFGGLFRKEIEEV